MAPAPAPDGDRPTDEAVARQRRKADLLAASSLLRVQAGAAIDEIGERVGRVETLVASVRARVSAWREAPILRSARPWLLPAAVAMAATWAVRRLLRPRPVPPTAASEAPIRAVSTRRPAAPMPARGRGQALLSLVAAMPRLWRWAAHGRRLWWAWRWWSARRTAPGRGGPTARTRPKDPGPRSVAPRDRRSPRG